VRLRIVTNAHSSAAGSGTASLGIDLGTTNSVAAVSFGGAVPQLVPLSDDADDWMLPSVVAYREGQEPLVGKAARRRSTGSVACTYSSVKRLLGREFASFSKVRRCQL
jgi:molecular chaperone HscA